MANTKIVQPAIQPAAKRIKNFNEVAMGFSKAQAVSECQRCPQCSDPECVKACPLGINIPEFIRLIREGDFSDALQKIRESNSLAGICGRVCSAPCEVACILNREKNPQPIAIRALERSAFDFGNIKFQEIFNAQATNKTGKKVAVIGSGAAGLMAGANLLEDGHDVTIFEALQKAGGFLQYGIPEFRLPKKVLDTELEYVSSLGVEIRFNMMMGQAETMSELFDNGYDAVLLATGLCFGPGAELPGYDARGVLTSQEFLFRINFLSAHLHPKYATTLPAGKRVVIIGSGYDALDCARLALRLGKKVTLLHPSTEDDVSAVLSDRLQAQEEGMQLEVLTKPLEVIKEGKGAVKGVRCVRLDFADSNGQWKLMPVKDSVFTVDADSVIVCGQYTANTAVIALTPGLTVQKQNFLCAKKERYATSLKGVFAAGGLARGPVSLIETLSQGKAAADEIDRYLQELPKGKI
ncbi:MAG: FAD-dependent oxidoreductase [Candidatus Omnitrophota bacterium]